MKSLFSNTSLDITNRFHVAFTYSLLLDKYRLPNAIINNTKTPSLEEHINWLKTSPYHCFYLMKCGNTYFGEQFIDKQFKYGVYYKKTKLRRILKKYKDIDFERPIGVPCFISMLQAHPEVTYLTGEINTSNLLSINSAKRLGFREKYIVLEYKKDDNIN